MPSKVAKPKISKKAGSNAGSPSTSPKAVKPALTTHVESPGGGYFLWITAPQDLSTFCHQLEKNGVGVLPGWRASSSTPQSSNLFASCRLSIAFFTEEKIALACKTIVQLAKGGEVAPLT